VVGASGVLGTCAAKISTSSEKAEKPNALRD
jgi:hypothetical protein